MIHLSQLEFHNTSGVGKEQQIQKHSEGLTIMEVFQGDVIKW